MIRSDTTTRPAGWGDPAVVLNEGALRVFAPRSGEVLRNEQTHAVIAMLGIALGEQPPMAIVVHDGRVEEHRPRSSSRTNTQRVGESRARYRRTHSASHVSGIVYRTPFHEDEWVREVERFDENAAFVGPRVKIVAGRECDLALRGFRIEDFEEHVPSAVQANGERIADRRARTLGSRPC